MRQKQEKQKESDRKGTVDRITVGIADKEMSYSVEKDRVEKRRRSNGDPLSKHGAAEDGETKDRREGVRSGDNDEEIGIAKGPSVNQKLGTSGSRSSRSSSSSTDTLSRMGMVGDSSNRAIRRANVSTGSISGDQGPKEKSLHAGGVSPRVKDSVSDWSSDSSSNHNSGVGSLRRSSDSPRSTGPESYDSSEAMITAVSSRRDRTGGGGKEEEEEKKKEKEKKTQREDAFQTSPP